MENNLGLIYTPCLPNLNYEEPSFVGYAYTVSVPVRDSDWSVAYAGDSEAQPNVST